MANKAKVKFEIDGLENLKRVLKETTKRVAVEELNVAVRNTCNRVLQSAKDRAPFKLGDLKNAIEMNLGARSLTGRIGLSGNPVPSRGGASSHYHPHVYGIFQEFGAKRNDAERFMRDAVAEQGTYFQEELQRAGSRLENRLDIGG